MSDFGRKIDWDPRKDQNNQKKHGISFDIAAQIFDDPNAIMLPNRVEGGEERYHSIGAVLLGSPQAIVLTVVHTYREENSVEIFRIISARRAARHERKLYVETL